MVIVFHELPQIDLQMTYSILQKPVEKKIKSMRKYIRHPSDIPIEFNINNVDEEQRLSLSNISEGGLSFFSTVKLDVGSYIHIRIPVVDPPFETKGRVAWCTEVDERYEIGAEILGKDQVYRTRMVEQICHIEHYKNEVCKNEGRCMSGKEAAMEWINKYASDFPKGGS